MRHAAVSLLLILGLAPALALAKSGDRNQPMEIDADRTDALMSDDSVSTLEGNVRIRQGTLDVSAARAEVHRVAGEIRRIVLTGNPAVMKQVSDAGEPMTARANTITYTLGEQHMLLTASVVLEQARGSLRGETIKYDMASGRIDGGGDGQRVSLRILPKTAPAD